MYTSIIDITPKVAEEMLEKNTNNYRNISMSKVHMYARKMMMGFWQENGEAIQFDKNGKLLNGQHRLRAIIESNTTQRMLVVYDVDADVFDSGKVRSLHEYAKINGTVGGAITVILSKCQNNQRQFIGNEEKAEYYKNYQEYFDKAFLFASRGAATAIIRKAGCVAAIYCALRFNLMPDSEIEAFCKIVNSGLPEAGYASETPLVLRKMIMQFANGNGGGALLVNCFDATWQALIAFKRGIKSRRSFKPNGNFKEVFDKLVELEKGATA